MKKLNEKRVILQRLRLRPGDLVLVVMPDDTPNSESSIVGQSVLKMIQEAGIPNVKLAVLPEKSRILQLKGVNAERTIQAIMRYREEQANTKAENKQAEVDNGKQERDGMVESSSVGRTERQAGDSEGR